MEKSQGVGSIWNNNNWFYEEKNYKKFAHEYLTEEICKLVVTHNDITVKLYEMKEISGEASVTIRKQKQIFLFDIEGEIYFEAFKVSDPSTQCKGKMKFHEVNQDDDELCLEVTQEKPTDFVSDVKRVIANQVNEALLKCIMTLPKAMKNKDSDDNKVKRDQMEREHAKKAVEEAKKNTGDEKQKIFDDAKKQEADMKKAQAEKAKLNMIPMKETKVNNLAGSGSTWNNNSYHWEQKSVDKWAEDTLKKVLSLFYFKHESATFKITEVKDLKGDSSISIRKQKKIVTYEYQMKLIWKCDMGDSDNTKVLGSIEGELFCPELSNDIIQDDEEWDFQVSIKNGDETLKKTLYQLVKKMAPDALRKAIQKDFVEELNKK